MDWKFALSIVGIVALLLLGTFNIHCLVNPKVLKKWSRPALVAASVLSLVLVIAGITYLGYNLSS